MQFLSQMLGGASQSTQGPWVGCLGGALLGSWGDAPCDDAEGCTPADGEEEGYSHRLLLQFVPCCCSPKTRDPAVGFIDQGQRWLSQMSQEEKYLHDQCNNISLSSIDQVVETVMGTRPFIPICQQLPIKISILVLRVTRSNIIDLTELLLAHMINITQRCKLCS